MARRLRDKQSGKEIEPPALKVGHFHIFLSHTWAQGEETMRTIKLRLLAMMTELMYLCAFAYLVVLLLPTIPTWGKAGHATLGRREGWLLFGCYAAAVVAWGVWVYFGGKA